MRYKAEKKINLLQAAQVGGRNQNRRENEFGYYAWTTLGIIRYSFQMLTLREPLPHQKKINSDFSWMPVIQGRKCIWLIGKHLIPPLGGIWFGIALTRVKGESSWQAYEERSAIFSGRGKGETDKQKCAVHFKMRAKSCFPQPSRTDAIFLHRINTSWEKWD